MKDASEEQVTSAEHDAPRPKGRGQKYLEWLVGGVALVLIVLAGRSIMESSWETQQGTSANRAAGLGVGAAPKKVVRKGGKTLLWANYDRETLEPIWFDVTGSTVDPREFNHGIGKDSIAAIDEGLYLPVDDPQLSRYGVSDTTRVLGYESGGQARAYPLGLMIAHELVNDTIAGKPITVGW